MYFGLNEEQERIQEAARDLLAARFKPDRIRELSETAHGFDEEDWREMVGLGWAGLAVGEEWGGAGLGAVELAVIFEQAGFALAPSPLLSNTVAALALDRLASDSQKEEFLRPIVEGERRATVAVWDAGTRAEPGDVTMEARADGNGVVLDGEKIIVWDAAAADFMLVATEDGARHIIEADADGVEIAETPSIDPTRKIYSVRFDGVRVDPERTIDCSPEDVIPVRDRLCIALSAELTGVAQRTLDMAVAYAKERQQFGRAIGAYQAVSHRCAEMLLDTESARSATYYAAWTADAEPESLPLAASVAKAKASEAGFQVAAASLQIHGGIGFTWEHDLHLWFKRARADAAAVGDARWHRERVANLVVDRATAAVA